MIRRYIYKIVYESEYYFRMRKEITTNYKETWRFNVFLWNLFRLFIGNTLIEMLLDCNLVSEREFLTIHCNSSKFQVSGQHSKGGSLLSFISFREKQLFHWVRRHQQVKGCEVNDWEKETREHFPTQTTGPWSALVQGLVRTHAHVCQEVQHWACFAGTAHRMIMTPVKRKLLNLFQSNPTCPY